MKFEKLDRMLQSYIPSPKIPGGEIIIWQHGKELFRKQYGFRDYLQKEPVQGDEFYFVYSCTKVLTCAALLHLIEEGKLSLDDRLSDYIPAFADVRLKDGSRPKNPILIRHCFSMSSGMNYDLNAPAIREALRKNPNAGAREIADAIAKIPLSFEPGSHYQYSLSHDVLAAVAEEICGKPFEEYVREWAFEPLGIKELYFEENEHTMANMAAHYAASEERAHSRPMINPYIFSPHYHSGGAGLIAKPSEYIKFFSALSMGGQGLLRPETIEMFKVPQLNEQALSEFRNKTRKKSYAYGLGVRVKVMENGGSPLGEFGWDGAAGAYSLVDTENELAVLYCQHVTGCQIAYDEVHEKIRDLLYQELNQ
ncbi:MAG: beta-lactamase family protein [Clostridia bacterium]|nr:beta-lactamase family protein [Clostridia bacterium]